MAPRAIALPGSLLSQLPSWVPFADAIPLDNHGGFSGASLWQIPTGNRSALCLRCWPEGTSAERVRSIHDALLLLRRADLDFIPHPLPLVQDSTIVIADDRIWELSVWCEGMADYRDRPNEAKLTAAVNALARIHVAWSHHRPSIACPPIPAVERRWHRSIELQSAMGSRIRDALNHGVELSKVYGITGKQDEQFRDEASRFFARANESLPQIVNRLDAARRVSVPLQLCLRDIWHDHVLFVDDRVTGIVDFDAIGVDSVATDLARMLGSMVDRSSADWHVALRAYRAAAPLSDLESDLVTTIDQANIVLNGLHWLQWLYVDCRPIAEWDRVADRFRQVSCRLFNFTISDLAKLDT